ncbi:MAG: GNAT family N-acetyltransferase [Vulcanimicrobiota bacterium]
MIPGKKINLWAIEREDLLQNYLWANDPEIVKLAGMDVIPKTAWDIEKWYETNLSNPNIQEFAIKMDDGTYIGNIELTNMDWRSGTAEIGILIGDRNRRNKGFASEALRMTARYAFEELGLHRIYAKVLSFNQKAQKLFETNGYQKEGVLREAFFTWGKYWDVTVYSILDREFAEKFPYQPLEEATEETS